MTLPAFAAERRAAAPLLLAARRCRSIIIIIIIKDIYIAQVRKGHKCAMSVETAAWLRNCRCLYS